MSVRLNTSHETPRAPDGTSLDAPPRAPTNRPKHAASVESLAPPGPLVDPPEVAPVPGTSATPQDAASEPFFRNASPPPKLPPPYTAFGEPTAFVVPPGGRVEQETTLVLGLEVTTSQIFAANGKLRGIVTAGRDPATGALLEETSQTFSPTGEALKRTETHYDGDHADFEIQEPWGEVKHGTRDRTAAGDVKAIYDSEGGLIERTTTREAGECGLEQEREIFDPITHDPTNRVVTELDACGRPTHSETFDTMGDLTARTTWAYDPSGTAMTQEVLDPADQSLLGRTSTAYDAEGDLISGAFTTYHPDVAGVVTGQGDLSFDELTETLSIEESHWRDIPGGRTRIDIGTEQTATGRAVHYEVDIGDDDSIDATGEETWRLGSDGAYALQDQRVEDAEGGLLWERGDEDGDGHLDYARYTTSAQGKEGSTSTTATLRDPDQDGDYDTLQTSSPTGEEGALTPRQGEFAGFDLSTLSLYGGEDAAPDIHFLGTSDASSSGALPPPFETTITGALDNPVGVSFDGSTIAVTVPLKFFAASEDVTRADIEQAMASWSEAIDASWNGHTLTIPGKNGAPSVEVPVVFQFEPQIVDGPEDGAVAITHGASRANAAAFGVTTPPSTIAHEFGHWIGLVDRYKDPLFPSTFPSDGSLQPTSIMGAANAHAPQDLDIQDAVGWVMDAAASSSSRPPLPLGFGGR